LINQECGNDLLVDVAGNLVEHADEEGDLIAAYGFGVGISTIRQIVSFARTDGDA